MIYSCCPSAGRAEATGFLLQMASRNRPFSASPSTFHHFRPQMKTTSSVQPRNLSIGPSPKPIMIVGSEENVSSSILCRIEMLAGEIAKFQNVDNSPLNGQSSSIFGGWYYFTRMAKPGLSIPSNAGVFSVLPDEPLNRASPDWISRARSGDHAETNSSTLIVLSMNRIELHSHK